jgi:hypothetical protein
MFTSGRKHYTPVAVSDEDNGEEEKYALYSNRPWGQAGVVLTRGSRIQQKKRLLSIILIIAYTLVVLSIGAVVAQGLIEVRRAWYLSEPSQHRCSKLGVRREWRNLSSTEQEDYTNAAVCFSALKNPYGSNGTLYDEFSRVHRSVGALCRYTPLNAKNASLILFAFSAHESASFLPWHRYFLRIYEDILKIECGFEGSVP